MKFSFADDSSKLVVYPSFGALSPRATCRRRQIGLLFMIQVEPLFADFGTNMPPSLALVVVTYFATTKETIFGILGIPAN
jgi:hypothetical protein